MSLKFLHSTLDCAGGRHTSPPYPLAACQIMHRGVKPLTAAVVMPRRLPQSPPATSIRTKTCFIIRGDSPLLGVLDRPPEAREEGHPSHPLLRMTWCIQMGHPGQNLHIPSAFVVGRPSSFTMGLKRLRGGWELTSTIFFLTACLHKGTTCSNRTCRGPEVVVSPRQAQRYRNDPA
jgi:hypothetical protein